MIYAFLVLAVVATLLVAAGVGHLQKLAENDTARLERERELMGGRQ